MVDTLIFIPTVSLSNTSILLSTIINQTNHSFDLAVYIQDNKFMPDQYFSMMMNILATYDVDTMVKNTNFLSIGLARYEGLILGKKLGYKNLLFVDDDVFWHPMFFESLMTAKSQIEKDKIQWAYLEPTRFNIGERRYQDGGNSIDYENWFWPIHHNEYIDAGSKPYERIKHTDLDTACCLINLSCFDPKTTVLDPRDFPPRVSAEDFSIAQDITRSGSCGVHINNVQFLHIVYSQSRRWTDNGMAFAVELHSHKNTPKEILEERFPYIHEYKQLVDERLKRNK